MQPIHYSLIFNLAVLIVTGWLAYVFAQPLVVVVGLLVAQHVLGRFGDDDDEEEESRPIGFTADVD